MSSVIIKGDTSGQITLSAPAVAGTNTLTLPTITGTVGVLVSGTSVSASGTSVDFTSIPAGVRRITVLMNGVSTSGTSALLVQLGDAGGFENTGYVSYGAQCGGSATSTNGTTSTAGMVVIRNNAADTYNGAMTVSNITSNTWVASYSFGGLWAGSLNAGYLGGGNKSLSETLDRIRITTVNGTDTFDAGSINILYE